MYKTIIISDSSISPPTLGLRKGGHFVIVLWQKYMEQIIYKNCGNEIKSRMIFAVVNAIYAIA